ncbi:hypothetical protein MtrunA17_Chr4g0052761 [Medicago truncatula]|uniref:Uncharacterized protein n=1 Tax=Medicago truncatula TaxID=3880 RepID=A0A396IGN1_MEDTR|nr:hypothetical protein MtrunA17_Chr4g0052761 [Medicago truncatula]
MHMNRSNSIAQVKKLKQSSNYAIIWKRNQCRLEYHHLLNLNQNKQNNRIIWMYDTPHHTVHYHYNHMEHYLK